MPEIDDLDLEETDVTCPKCGELMFAHFKGDEPDNMVSWLLCKFCGFEEKE